MIRTISYCERNLQCVPPNVITVQAATATIIFVDQRYGEGEIAVRYVQNTGANRLYLVFGAVGGTSVPNVPTPAPVNATDYYHAYIEPGQLFDCSPSRLPVSGYSTAGTTVSTVVMYRNDLSPAQ